MCRYLRVLGSLIPDSLGSSATDRPQPPSDQEQQLGLQDCTDLLASHLLKQTVRAPPPPVH